MALLVNAVNLSAQPAAYTLDQCVDLALKQNRSVLAAKLKAQAEKHRERGVRADYLPKVQAQGIAFYAIDGKVSGFFETVVDSNPAVVQIGAAQPTTQLLKVFYASRIAGADRAIAEADSAAVRAEIVNAVKQLYWKTLELEAQGDAVAASRRFLEARLADARAAGQAGKLLPDAVSEVEARLIEVRKNQVELAGGLEVARMNMALLLGLPDAEAFQLAGSEALAQPVLEAAAAREELLRARPEVRRAELTSVKAKAAVSLARTEYLPEITAMVGEFRQKGFPFVPVTGAAATFTLTWNLFDWGKRENLVRERRSLLRAADLQAAEQREKVRIELRQALRNLETARETVELSQAQRRVAAERLRIAEDQHSVGRIGDADLLERRMQAAVAEARLTAARCAHNSQAAEVERAAGITR